MMRRTFEGSAASAITLGIICAFALCASACEVALTRAEIATDRSRGVEFFGRKVDTRLGWVVNAAGDLNGDGFDDFAIAAPYVSSTMGAVYVVFGRSAADWVSATFDFSLTDTPDAASWIKISNTVIDAYLGGRGLSPGDFNGDGLSDLLFSSFDGKIFCLFGHRGNWSSFDSASIEDGTTPGFVINLNSPNKDRYAGNAGDMNGDGIDDIIASTLGLGKAFVVFGIPGDNRSNFNASTVNGEDGFVLADGDNRLGVSLAMGSAGDVNGDGLADLALSSISYNDFTGRVYVLFARNVSASGQQWPVLLNLTTDLDGHNGFIVDGPAKSSYLGYSVVGAGDVNGDGFADVFIGSNSASIGAWILFGHPVPWNSPLNASQLDGTNGFRFASNGTEYWGYSGGGAGDVNGDGFDDIVVGSNGGALDSFGTNAGAAAMIFGHSGTWPAELSRNDAVGSVGFLIDGPSAGSTFGWSARGAGDVNRDGLADVIVGAPLESTFAENAGYVALVFGVADDHCAVCSNTTDECIVCDDGFFLNGTVCTSNTNSSSSSASQSSGGSKAAASASGTVVVVIETGGDGGTVGEVAAEVAQLLGVDVGQISVVEITPGTFEVTVVNEEVAQQLVTLITQCIEDGASEQQL